MNFWNGFYMNIWEKWILFLKKKLYLQATKHKNHTPNKSKESKTTQLSFQQSNKLK